MDELHRKNKKVFLVSGGFRCLIGPVAEQLDIPADHVCANRLKFFYNGLLKKNVISYNAIFHKI